MDKRKTHKGKEIDIDFIRMKHELELKEINKINIKREKEIDGKRRRGNSTKINEMLANQEMMKQKLREQKNKKAEDEMEDKVEAQVETPEVEPKIERETPELTGTGRRIAKR